MYDNLDERKFEMRYYYNQEITNDVCSRDLISESEFDRAKITCEVEKLGAGKYTFIGVMKDSEENTVDFEVNVLKIQDEVYSQIEFIEEGDKTHILINVEGEGENLLVKNRIPKEVIELLTPENKDTLITTDFEYENTIATVNKDLYNGLETVFLITSPKFAFISSTIIREVHIYGGDVSKYIPYEL